MEKIKSYTVDKNGILEVGGVNVVELTKKYGTPLYVYNVDTIEQICSVYRNTLASEYGNGRVAYASKAFSCKEIYRIMDGLSMSADVVSAGEIYTAVSTGFDAKKLIFHGNNKTIEELEYAVSVGVGIFVLDSLIEAERLNFIAQEKGIKIDCLLRVNPGIEAHTHHYIQTAKIDSKFGWSLDNGDAQELIGEIIKKENLNLKGLHCHIGSQIFEIKSFLLATQKMMAFYRQIYDYYGISFDVINLGGGFGVWYSDEDKQLSLDDYKNFVTEICRQLKQSIEENKLNSLELILEPGRSIVAEAGVTLYKAGTIKTIKDIKNYIAIDGGMFDNPRFALYQAKYTVLPATKMNEKAVETYTLAGKCCESGDIIAENCILPKIVPNDILAVLSTGAYNYSMASNYNRNFVPSVVMIKNGKDYVAVKRQTFEDLVRNDI